MAVYTTNQNRQFFVASEYSATVTDASNVGAIGAVKCVADGLGQEMYFLYRGADTVLKSDRIQLKNLDYIKAFKASDMVTPLKKVEVTLDSTVNSGAPVSGQDYLLRIEFRQFYGMSDEDQYFKDVAVHATAAMTDAKALFDAMKNALDLAFSREVGATKTANPYLNFSVSGSGSSAKLVIMEKPQSWHLGIEAQERVYFDVYPTTIYTGGDDVIWGVVTDATVAKASATVGTDAIGNGHTIADMEYFYMGERGDFYRYAGWPNYIPTKYLVDPSKEYNVLEIHYAFTDTGVNSYRSEKDITIVFPVGASDHEYDEINDFIGAINTATGLTVATLS